MHKSKNILQKFGRNLKIAYLCGQNLTATLPMNILITNISTLPQPKDGKDPREITYQIRVSNCNATVIKAYHTNESIIRCLSHYEPLIQTGGIHKVIALVSKQAYDSEHKVPFFGNRTAYQYCVDCTHECINADVSFYPIQIDQLKTEAILDELCQQITSNDIVYIDSAGGQRTVSNILQVLTSILRHIGIQNPRNFYSSSQRGEDSYITTTEEFVRMTDLSAAFNEFMTTGKADQLNICFADIPVTDAIRSLLNAMTDFSDKIRIGSVEALDTTLAELRIAIDACKAQNDPGQIETIILRQFLPIIEQKLLGNSQSTKIDYIKLIDWCLDNVLIQQALTIFKEKIAKSLFDYGIIYCKRSQQQMMQEYQERCENNKGNIPEWETDMLEQKVICYSAKTLADECLKVLSGRTSQSTLAIKIASYIARFQNTQTFIRSTFKDEKMQSISNFISEKNFSTYEKFIKSLHNGAPIQFWQNLFGYTTRDLDTTTDKRLCAIEEMASGQYENLDLGFRISLQRMAEVCASYEYIRAFRNQTNHASNDENLTPENKQFLSQFGFDFSEVKLTVIRKNIELALNYVKQAITDVLNIE